MEGRKERALAGWLRELGDFFLLSAKDTHERLAPDRPADRVALSRRRLLQGYTQLVARPCYANSKLKTMKRADIVL